MALIGGGTDAQYTVKRPIQPLSIAKPSCAQHAGHWHAAEQAVAGKFNSDMFEKFDWRDLGAAFEMA